MGNITIIIKDENSPKKLSCLLEKLLAESLLKNLKNEESQKVDTPNE